MMFIAIHLSQVLRFFFFYYNSASFQYYLLIMELGLAQVKCNRLRLSLLNFAANLVLSTLKAYADHPAVFT